MALGSSLTSFMNVPQRMLIVNVCFLRLAVIMVAVAASFCCRADAQAIFATQPASSEPSNSQSGKPEKLSVVAVKSSCRVFIGKESGTCFLVSRERNGKQQTVLVTAAHLFQRAKGKAAKLVFRSDTGRKEITIPFQDSVSKPLWKKHSKYDIAALAVDLPRSKFVNVFSMDQLADQPMFDSELVTVGHACKIPCFPAKLESTSLGYPVLRTGSIASYPLSPVFTQPTFKIDVSAFGGDSGAPVLVSIDQLEGKDSAKGQSSDVALAEYSSRSKRLMVVGLVFAKQRQTARTVTPYEERVQHMPMAISIAVNSVFIRETIEAVAE